MQGSYAFGLMKIKVISQILEVQNPRFFSQNLRNFAQNRVLQGRKITKFPYFSDLDLKIVKFLPFPEFPGSVKALSMFRVLGSEFEVDCYRLLPCIVRVRHQVRFVHQPQYMSDFWHRMGQYYQ